MASLPTPSEITSLASLLAPGLIIAIIRERVITGSVPNMRERLVTYAVVSVAYFAAISPFFHVEGGLKVPEWLWNILQFVVVPAVIGIAAAYSHQWKIVYRLADWANLEIAHHLPAAWDYMFQALPAGTFILVTLNDGSRIPGRMGRNSFASSSNEERDLLIEELWEIGDDGEWSAVIPERNILLCGKDIRHIEVF